MDTVTLKQILEDHQKWLDDDEGTDANLSRADLGGADLSRADLSDADLSRAKGIPSAIEWLSQFERDNKGIIVYRVQKGQYNPPAHWKFESGEFLTEVPNPDRGTECGCGVAFATLDWLQKNNRNGIYWKCRINWLDLAGVIVPFNTDGKARCERLELLEVYEEEAESPRL